jgi:hypothetical protein
MVPFEVPFARLPVWLVVICGAFVPAMALHAQEPASDEPRAPTTVCGGPEQEQATIALSNAHNAWLERQRALEALAPDDTDALQSRVAVQESAESLLEGLLHLAQWDVCQPESNARPGFETVVRASLAGYALDSGMCAEAAALLAEAPGLPWWADDATPVKELLHATAARVDACVAAAQAAASPTPDVRQGGGETGGVAPDDAAVPAPGSGGASGVVLVDTGAEQTEGSTSAPFSGAVAGSVELRPPRRRAAAWAMTLAGVAPAAAAVGLGVHASQLRNDARDLLQRPESGSQSEYERLRAQSERESVAAVGLSAVAGALTTTGIIWLASQSTERSPSRGSLTVLPRWQRGVGVEVHYVF